MDAQQLGIKTAALVEQTIETAVVATRSTHSTVSTFCKAFSTELAARRAARRVPDVGELDGTATPF